MNGIRSALRKLESVLGADPGPCECKGRGKGTGWRIMTVYSDGRVLDADGGETCSLCGRERPTIVIETHPGGLAEELCLQSKVD